MRTRMYGLLTLLVLATGGFVALSLTRGQERDTLPTTLPTAPPTAPPDRGNIDHDTLPPAVRPGRVLSEVDKKREEQLQAAQRGAEWLSRMNGVDGRFAYGQNPALNRPLEGDHYLRQLGAAFALARAARFTRNQDEAARAIQAVLRFLDETIVDPQNPQVRYPADASASVNRLAAAGLLVLAVYELPAPQTDVLDKAEQLCNFIRTRQQADGSLRCTDTPGEKTAEDTPDAAAAYPGPALYALMRSQSQRAAPWKTDLVRKALPYYQAWWRAHKSLALVPWQSAAYTEAFLATREPAFATFVFELNDWACGLQYDRFDPRHPDWCGGFKNWTDGTVVASVPQAGSAAFAEGLVEACRAAQQQGDVSRYDRYKAALELDLQFIRRLQYSAANTGHFNVGYRDYYLLGGFHASPEDGTLRLDYTQHAVSALVQYLQYINPGS